MLKDEVMKTFDLLKTHNVLEEEVEKIFYNGLYFDYTYGDPDYNHQNRRLNSLQVGELIEYLDKYNIECDLNQIIQYPYNFKYPELIKMIADSKDDDEIIIIKKKKFNN